jgi:hypothetical protein
MNIAWRETWRDRRQIHAVRMLPDYKDAESGHVLRSE